MLGLLMGLELQGFLMLGLLLLRVLMGFLVGLLLLLGPRLGLLQVRGGNPSGRGAPPPAEVRRRWDEERRPRRRWDEGRHRLGRRDAEDGTRGAAPGEMERDA